MIDRIDDARRALYALPVWQAAEQAHEARKAAEKALSDRRLELEAVTLKVRASPEWRALDLALKEPRP